MHKIGEQSFFLKHATSDQSDDFSAFIKKIVPIRTCTKWLYAHALGLFSSDDPGLTLTIFMTGSNLFPGLSVQLIQHLVLCISKFVLMQHIFSTQVSDTEPMVLWLDLDIERTLLTKYLENRLS